MEPKRSKARASGIDHNYLKRPDRLVIRKRYWAAGIFAVGIVACLALRFAFSDNWRQSFSTGPICKSHQPIAKNCQSCHVSFSPANEGTIFGLFAAKDQEPWTRPADQKCLACHPASYGSETPKEMERDGWTFPVFTAMRHCAVEKESDVSACASCHLEHEDELAGHLRATSNETCTRCHADLAQHLEPGTATQLSTSITAIDGHPAFRSTASDPGKIKFSHARHLAKGLRLEGELESMSLKADSELASLGYGQEGEEVQLDCSHCHQPATDGRYYSYPAFATSCKPCHQMPILGTDQSVTHPSRAAGAGNYQSRIAKEIEDALPAPTPVQEQASDKYRVAQAVQLVSDRCLQCHVPQSAASPGEIPHVHPPAWKPIWLEMSVFDHRAHQNIKCDKCHADFTQEPPVSLLASTSSSHVLMPNLAVCVECHTTQSQPATPGPTGCYQCHHYHGHGNRYFADPDWPSFVDLLKKKQAAGGGG